MAFFAITDDADVHERERGGESKVVEPQFVCGSYLETDVCYFAIKLLPNVGAVERATRQGVSGDGFADTWVEKDDRQCLVCSALKDGLWSYAACLDELCPAELACFDKFCVKALQVCIKPYHALWGGWEFLLLSKWAAWAVVADDAVDGAIFNALKKGITVNLSAKRRECLEGGVVVTYVLVREEQVVQCDLCRSLAFVAAQDVDTFQGADALKVDVGLGIGGKSKDGFCADFFCTGGQASHAEYVGCGASVYVAVLADGWYVCSQSKCEPKVSNVLHGAVEH